MASSSSLTVQSKYDVFLSFRGEDTRNGFTSHLAAALHRKQIQFFIDDEELKKGDEISPALSNAIETSDISIIVFSKNYASSRWCLNELVKILDCNKIVIPVFYQVDPSDVRKQRGSFGEAFDHHENNFPDKVQKWRDALTQASNLSGYDSTESRDEAKLVGEIVADISKKLEDMSDSTDADGFVGLNSRIEEMKSLLCLESHDVRIVGIWGMGGIGKTTIASVVFHHISKHFQGKCFMPNVREKSNKTEVIHVRDEVISQVLGENLKIGTLTIPPNVSKRLQRMKVLIVLDDVHDEFTQLESLAGGVERFSPGSRIIITTRDKRVLDKCGVKHIYRVKGLKPSQAFELFCRKAFRQNNCSHDLLELSKEVVHFTGGNPLALEVLGSSLYQKSKQQWTDKLHNLKLISESSIHKVLKVSYDELNSEEKEIFLDIACFFKGEHIEFVTMIHEDSMSVRDVLNILVDKSLITLSFGKRIQMHDLLQELGQEIVRQESIKEPGKRSRLYDHNDVYHVLKKNKGTDAIEGIFLNLSIIKHINLGSRAFKKMSNLRLLKFYIPKGSRVLDMSIKVQLRDGLDYLPEKLRYLHWHGYPLRTLPSNFKPENLVVLKMPFSKVVQIWEEKKKAFKIKYIDLSNSQYLIRIPNPSETRNLERINLLNCTNLACVPSSIQNFNHLSRLCFKGCKSLRSFPSNLHFVCPISIDFSSCVNLTEFPQISGKIRGLCLCETAIEEVPSSIECLTDLKYLRLGNCKRLKRVSTSICKLKSLVNFILLDCLNLEHFPEILEKMENLEYLCLRGTAITKLPSSFENLKGLQMLILEGCSKLNNLPDNIGNLKSLFYINANGSAISQLPSSVEDSKVLKILRFIGCRGLVSLPESLLTGLSSLQGLDLTYCALTAIPQEIGCLSSLESLCLSGNNLESLPASIKQLSRLRELDLRDCNMLQSLPELPLCLQLLTARNCKRLRSLPEIRSCLEELDASVLEKLSENSFRSPQRLEYCFTSEILFQFTNCLKLNEKADNKILANSRLRIQHMTIASLRVFYERAKNEGYAKLKGPTIFLPGSEIPDWFRNQSSGSSISIQLPPHCFSRNLIGFAFCAVIDFEEVTCGRFECESGPHNFDAKCPFGIKIQILSETKHVDLDCYLAGIKYSVGSDHVVLGFNPCVNVGLPYGNHHTTVLFKFYASKEDEGGNEVKRCGVCPVYANPNETNPNTLNLNFATEIWKLDGMASTSRTSTSHLDWNSDEEELEPSPKRICRDDQINTP